MRGRQPRFALLLASLALLAGLGALAADPPPPEITTTIVDNCDGRVPLGGPVTFELRDLKYTSGQTTGEYPDPGGNAWTIEWSHDRVTWTTATPDKIKWTPPANLLGTTGRFDVWARISVAIPAEGGPQTIGPTEFTHFVRLIGVGTVECSLDGGATWVAPSSVVAVPEQTTVLFRATPAGGELFPAGKPVWDSTLPGLTLGPLEGTRQLPSGQASASVGSPWSVTAACGTSTRAPQGLTVGVARILRRSSAQGEYTVIDQSAPVPVGTTVHLRAEAKPAGAPWPAGQPQWSGAQATPGEPAEATVSFSSPAPSAVEAEAVTASCGSATSAGLLPCAITGFRYRIGAAGDFEDLPADILYVPLNVAVFLQAVITPVGAAWPPGEPVWSENAQSGAPYPPGEAVFLATTPFALAGEPEVVQATCGSSSAAAQIAALNGLTIFATREYLGVGDSITLEAKRIVAGALVSVDCDWTLLSGATDAAFEGTTTGTASVTLTGLSVSMQYTGVVVKATDSALPTEFDTAGFTVTTIRLYASIDGGTLALVTGNLYVPKGSTVTFEADLLPNFSPWPPEGPEWTGATPGAALETATAGFPDTSPSAQDPELVTVTCGGSAAAAVVVYDLGPIRWRLTDADEWAECGEVLAVPEDIATVQLEASILPAGVPASVAAVSWSVTPPDPDYCASGMIVAQTQPVPGAPGRILVTLSGTLPDTTMGYPTLAAAAGGTTRSVQVGSVGLGLLQYKGFGMADWRIASGSAAVSVPVATPIQVRAVPNPLNAPLPEGQPTWNDADSGATPTGVEVAVTYPVVSSDCSDVRTLEASFAGQTRTARFVVCTVEGLEYRTEDMASFAPADHILVTLPNRPLYFRALIAPSCAPWPGLPLSPWPPDAALSSEVKPTWQVGLSAGQAADILRAPSGSQEIVLVRFSIPTPASPDGMCSTESVRAECGGSALARVIVVGGLTLVPERTWVEVGQGVTVRAVRDNGGTIQQVPCTWNSADTAYATVPAGPSSSAQVHGVAASDPMGVRIYATHAEYGSASVRIAVVSLDRLVVSENGTPANSAEDAAGGPTPGATLYVPAVRRGDLRLDLALHMTPDVLNFDGARRWRLDSAAGGSPAHWAPLAGDFGDATRRMARFHLPSGATPVPAADRDTVLSAWLDRNGNGSIDGGEPSCQVAVTLVDIVNVTATSTTDPSRTANGTDAAPGELYLPFSTGNSVTTASVFALSSCVVGGVSQWPAGRPAWSLSVATGGPSMALGNWGPDGGSYTFPSPGAYTFTAECGNAVEMTVNVVKVDVVGHKPGTIQSPGAAIAEADETDPAKLVTLVNEDIDEKDDLTALPDVPDNANTTIGSADDDIVKVVLKGPMPSLSSGTIGFSVDPPGSLRIRNAAGTAEVPASDLTVNLAAPAGCLAGLASGDEVTVLLEGLNPAANAVARLEYKRGTDVVASDEAHLTVMRMAFDHAQVNARNLVHADDDWKEFRHCLGVEWVAAKALDMAPLLTADSQAFLGMAEWRISGSSGTSVLSYGNIPGLHDVLRYRVEVRVKDGGPVADRLIVVVFPPATRQAFDAWVTANQDTTWMDALPAAYQALGTDNSDPEPPGQPTSCDPQRWDAPDSLSSYYHPGAAFEMRSIPEASRAGHQACYDGNGDLITIGVSAGSADRVGPDADASDHRDADVLPFIWAAQLDGNPVEPNWVLAPTNLDRPMIHEGTRIGQYLNLRRPIPNAKPLLAPGACSP